MSIKQALKWMLASGLLAFAAVALFVPSHAIPTTAQQVEKPAAIVNVDGMVRPAAAEVDLMVLPLNKKVKSRVQTAVYETASNPNLGEGVIYDSKVQLCQGVDCGCSEGNLAFNQHGFAQQSFAQPGFGYGVRPPTEFLPSKQTCAVDGNSRGRFASEPLWMNASQKDWEQYSYGEYIGPFRTPHVPEYRIRIGDSLEFVYLLTRRQSSEPYRFYVGDTISVASATDSTLNQPTVVILSDGTISLPSIGTIRVAGKTVDNLQRELNDRYTEFLKSPEIVVQVVIGDTPLNDLRDAVDARQGTGGQSRFATVSPDGTIQLPLIGGVPAIGLTLDEIGREVNARYRLYLGGVVVTPILAERAPRFIYVVGEVGQSGQFELTGPTPVLQAIALAQGFSPNGNQRQVVVFRRDANWRLIATKLDLNAALNGNRPHPSDEIWLRDSDIVLVPNKPIQLLSEAVAQYLTNTIYAIFPQQGVQFNFDSFESL